MIKIFNIVYYYFYFLLIKNRLDTPQKICEHQLKLWRKLQNKVVDRLAYYKQYRKKPLSAYPIINKQIWQAQFELMNTHRLAIEEIKSFAFEMEKNRAFEEKYKGFTVGLSSGTTGNPAVFILSKKEEYKWVSAVLVKVLGSMKKVKIAFFLRANNNLYESGNSQLIKFQYFDLFEQFDILLNKLNNYKPTVLVAPATVLQEIAKAQMKKKISISPIKVISVAEVLSNEVKMFILSTFRCIVSNVYQATEGFIAYTCSYGKMHLNEDSIIVEKEWLDDMRFIPIITDLHRETQPLVRYRLDDILEIDTDYQNQVCSCGFAGLVIKEVIGRENDLIWTYDDGQIVKIFPDSLHRCITLSGIDYENYQIKQDKVGEISITFDGCTLALSKLRQLVINAFDLLPYKINIVVYIGGIEKSLVHKYQKIISNVCSSSL